MTCLGKKAVAKFAPSSVGHLKKKRRLGPLTSVSCRLPEETNGGRVNNVTVFLYP